MVTTQKRVKTIKTWAIVFLTLASAVIKTIMELFTKISIVRLSKFQIQRGLNLSTKTNLREKLSVKLKKRLKKLCPG